MAMSQQQMKMHRIEDDEILFVTLILMYGEPPRSPFPRVDGDKVPDTWARMSSASLEAALQFTQDTKAYSGLIKDMMAELGHDPHQGLFTSYMHWAKEQWDGKANEKI